jgi:hypothetical protein
MKMAKRKQPMNKGRATSGGGASSNKRVEKPVVYGNRSVEASLESSASQIGSALGFRGDPVTGKPARAADDLGNYRAATCAEGPGGGRDVYKSGYQALHGTPAKGEPDRSPDPPAARRVGAESSLGKDPSQWSKR